MQRSNPSRYVSELCSGRLNVGALMALCEENYGRLSRLAPSLHQAQGSLVSRQSGTMDLYLHVLAQSRYTSEVRLTYLFDSHEAERMCADPDAHLRVYHDARQVEILDLRQGVLPLRTHYAHPALADKWQANLFLSKWLIFCLRAGHRLHSDPSCPQSLGSDIRNSGCLVRS
ncbi:DUF1249 domain-containing protein [Thiorhodococcus drewsii]|nr:DUF1249 domain-containing protein [Thiorhodococcus drewsii]